MKPRATLYVPGHPLAGVNGHVRRARFVLWSKLDGQDAPCHWCGIALRWEANSNEVDQLCADHVDGDTLNDDATNLVPSCRGCNANREDGTGYGRRSPVVCGHCGASFMPGRSTQRFCSGSCASTATVPRGTNAAHGTRSRYVRGCRCDECRAAQAAYFREYEKRRPNRRAGRVRR